MLGLSEDEWKKLKELQYQYNLRQSKIIQKDQALDCTKKDCRCKTREKEIMMAYRLKLNEAQV